MVSLALNTLTFIQLAYDLFPKNHPQRQVCDRVADLFFLTALTPEVRQGETLLELFERLPPFHPVLEGVRRVLRHSDLVDFGLFGSNPPARSLLRDKLRDRLLQENLRAEKEEKALKVEQSLLDDYRGSCSLRVLVKGVWRSLPPESLTRDERRRLHTDAEIKEWLAGRERPLRLFPINRDALHLDLIGNLLIDIAATGMPLRFRTRYDSLKACFRNFHSKCALVDLPEEFLRGVAENYRSNDAMGAFLGTIPLYQLAYNFAQSHRQLQLGVAAWGFLFGKQGSKTMPWTSRLQVPSDTTKEVMPGFVLRRYSRGTGKENGKHRGLYLEPKDGGMLVPKNSPVEPGTTTTSVLVRGVYPQHYGLHHPAYTQRKHQRKAFHDLVGPNPISRSLSLVGPYRDRPEFDALVTSFGEYRERLLGSSYEGISRDEGFLEKLREGLRQWSSRRADKELPLELQHFVAMTSEDETPWLTQPVRDVEDILRGNPVDLASPVYVKRGNAEALKRDTCKLGGRALPVDTLLNHLAQALLYPINLEQLDSGLSNYLPGSHSGAPSCMLRLKEAVWSGGKPGTPRHQPAPTVFNIDVKSCFKSVRITSPGMLPWMQHVKETVTQRIGPDEADLLDRIFMDFRRRLLKGDYELTGADADTIPPGSLPLGLPLTPSFWLYLTLPLAFYLQDQKAKGAVRWWSICGDDFMAILENGLSEQTLEEFTRPFFRFARELGLSYHFFKKYMKEEHRVPHTNRLTLPPAIQGKWQSCIYKNWPVHRTPLFFAGICVFKDQALSVTKVGEHLWDNPATMRVLRAKQMRSQGVHNLGISTALFRPREIIEDCGLALKIEDPRTGSKLEALEEQQLDTLLSGRRYYTHGGILYLDPRKLLEIEKKIDPLPSDPQSLPATDVEERVGRLRLTEYLDCWKLVGENAYHGEQEEENLKYLENRLREYGLGYIEPDDPVRVKLGLLENLSLIFTLSSGLTPEGLALWSSFRKNKKMLQAIERSKGSPSQWSTSWGDGYLEPLIKVVSEDIIRSLKPTAREALEDFFFERVPLVPSFIGYEDDGGTLTISKQTMIAYDKFDIEAQLRGLYHTIICDGGRGGPLLSYDKVNFRDFLDKYGTVSTCHQLWSFLDKFYERLNRDTPLVPILEKLRVDPGLINFDNLSVLFNRSHREVENESYCEETSLTRLAWDRVKEQTEEWIDWLRNKRNTLTATHST